MYQICSWGPHHSPTGWDYWNYTVNHWNTTGYNWNTPGYHWSHNSLHWVTMGSSVGNIWIPLVLLEHPWKHHWPGVRAGSKHENLLHNMDPGPGRHF
jgi:hypothetical protein